MKEKTYKEVGPNYRFFLAWRHAGFAGNLVILYGASRLLITAVKEVSPLTWLIPLFASLAAFCLWLADRRTRQIYRELVKAGSDLEEDNGPFKALEKVGIPEDAKWFPKKGQPLCKFFSQSFALDCFFLGSSVLLFIVSLYFLFSPPAPT